MPQKSATDALADIKNDAEEELLQTTSPGDDTPVLPTPPDGGWGWVIVFGSFMAHVITDGVSFSFGVLLNEFLTCFGHGRGATSWLCSLMIGATWGSGMYVFYDITQMKKKNVHGPLP